MPRLIPLRDRDQNDDPIAKAIEALEVNFGAVTRMDDPPEESSLKASDDSITRVTEVIEQLRQAGVSLMRQRKDFELPAKRYFVVRCPEDEELMIVSAGPRGGSWTGRCPLCGKAANKEPKAIVVEEILDPDREDQE